MSGPTPAQLMADNLVLTTGQVAFVLGLNFARGRKAGEPNRQLVAPLVADGRLHPVDAAQPVGRQTFSVADVARYLAGGAPVPFTLVQGIAS